MSVSLLRCASWYEARAEGEAQHESIEEEQIQDVREHAHQRRNVDVTLRLLREKGGKKKEVEIELITPLTHTQQNKIKQ